MARSNVNIPQAKNGLDTMKQEVARELGITLKQGYNGDLSSKDAGYIGGYMVKNMTPIRTMTKHRQSRVADGYKVTINYFARLTV